ncbi:cytochrome P450 [Parasphingorhabdus cellanae]|uniref:Cytochrome P450 n=1 Tax=Parasphingorhabdus cellanae TaxID=2806553 RepID=A0ABX7T6Z5_9SPHN|nr:cytochrome P450 [Parasphingorhabdus cellanae]QTD57271.1 cytochrome P450 [Parasphingorhabdus cellanae]
MRNHDRFSSLVDRVSMRAGGLPEKAKKIREKAWTLAPTLSHNDEASHKDYRSLVGSFFMPRKLKLVQPFVEERIETLLADIDDKGGRCDFLDAFSVPLPVSVIGEYLGMRHLGDETLKIWSDAFADEVGFLTDDNRAIEIAQLTLDCQNAMVKLSDERRGGAGEDIITALANAKLPDGRELENEEILSILVQLLVAGNETTTSTLNFSLINLAQSPECLERLRQDPNLIGPFIEEILRIESPIQGQFRKAVGDQKLGGETIPDGALIHIRFGSANHDEAIWGDHPLNINLEKRQPKPHMAFGNGIHFCVGAALSRLELRHALQAIVNRYSEIRLQVPVDQLPLCTHFHQRRHDRLPLEFIN